MKVPPGVALRPDVAWPADVARPADVAWPADVDPAQLVDTDELLDWAAGWNAVAAYAHARQAEGLAELARRPLVVGPDPTAAWRERGPVGSRRREHVADEVGVVLGISARAADARVEVARALTRLPGTAAALRSGRIDWGRAAILTTETVPLDPVDARRVEEQVLARGPRATPARFREAVRRAVFRTDPGAAAARAAQARADRFVRIAPADCGTAWIDAHLPVEVAATVDAVLTSAARRLAGDHAARAGRTMDQLRADALAAPFVKAAHSGVLDGLDLGGTPLAVPPLRLVLTPGGSSADEPADLVGQGPLPAAVVRPLVDAAVAVTDLAAPPPPEGGTYRPGPGLRRWVVDRDQRCRWPGCARTATHADLDHTTPWPAGATADHNLGPQCRHHHQVKQHLAYQLRQPSPGHFVWTLPTGRTVHVHPDWTEWTDAHGPDPPEPPPP